MGGWAVRSGVDVKEVRVLVGKGFGRWGETDARNRGHKVRGEKEKGRVCIRSLGSDYG